MTRVTIERAGLVVLLVSLTVVPGTLGQEKATEELAEVSESGERAEWTRRGEYERIVLTLSGQDVVVRREFGPGEKPKLELVDERGKKLPDGSYTWELRAVPKIDDKIRERLASIRESGDMAALREMRQRGLVPRGPQTRSGYVLVRDGKLLRREEEPQPAAPVEQFRQRVEGGLTVEGDLAVTGAKSFAVADPEDAGREIYFSALEGPEAGTYYRGSAATHAGRAVIDLPEFFAKVTESEGLTVQLTPLGGWARLWVEEKSPQRLVIRQVEGDPPIEFDYLVQGLRKGYADFRVERESDERTGTGRGVEGGTDR